MKEDAFILNAARLHLAEDNIDALKELAGKAVFIVRTFVPKKDWIAGKYDVSSAEKLAIAYPRYWLHLVNAYLIGGR